MIDSTGSLLRQALVEKLAESLAGPIPRGTPRQVFGKITFPGKVTAIVGMRRVGKSTFLHQMRRERLMAGTPLEMLPYLNFEDERLNGLEASHLGFLVDEHRRRVAADGPVTWCFDEIQAVPGWERFVRRLLDRGDVEIWITGSSASLLSREIATALRGRAWTVPLSPFSFAEALRHADQAVPQDPGFVTSEERITLERHLRTWLVAGGFPEAQGTDAASRRQLLQDYVDVAVLRDVVERHGVSNVTALRWLIRHLLGNAGGRFSVEKFYRALKSQGLAVAKDTLHQMLSYLEDCFVVRLVWMEAQSERQRMVNPRKAYPACQGLIPVFDRSGRANLGHALETAVLVELQRRRCEVTYVRTAGDREVDFLARDPLDEQWLIQVCADASDPQVASRELRPLVEAAERFPKAHRVLIVLSPAGRPAEIPPGIQVETALHWLLGPWAQGG